MISIPSTHTQRLLSTLLIAGLLTTLVACKEPTIEPATAQPWVDAWATSVSKHLKGNVEQAATSASVKEAIRLAANESHDKGSTKHPHYARLAEVVYNARKNKPGFVSNAALTESGASVLARLERVGEDGFIPGRYHAAKVREALKQLDTLRAKVDEVGEVEAGPQAKQAALAFVTSKTSTEFALDDANTKALTNHIMAHESGTGLKQQIDELSALSTQIADLEAQVERDIALGFMRYARNMRYFRTPDIFVHPRQDDRYNDPETRKRRSDKEKASYYGQLIWRHATFAVQKMNKANSTDILNRKIIDALAQALEPASIKTVLASLDPSPQYTALKKEHLRYKAIAESGGWGKKLSESKIRRGQSGAKVLALKKRLQKEGYFAANTSLNDAFDANLTDAIKAYQATHQMDETGKVGRSFWRSINVSAKSRRDQILLNMKRWRESDVRHHEQETYVLVNIPGFHAEIWDKQARQMRMRIVVGNNDRTFDDEKRTYVRPNRTPKLSAYIDRVIYNPFWNVTSRIRETEILVDVRKDLEGRYISKLDGLLKKKAASLPTGPATGLAGLMTPPTTTPTVAAVKPSASLVRKTSDGRAFDVDRIKFEYEQIHGTPLDVTASFPYMDTDTGLVNVSKTNPANVPPWYGANGYEVMHAGKSWEFVRQLNGKQNALGLVKVIFPNLHDVYLHDTNSKPLFRKTLRAFSHGCMRMHKPLDFSKWLLKHDGSWTDGRVKKVLANKIYEPIFLKAKVPVHVEYLTVRADDEGRANFLLDVYSYDN